MKVAEKLTKEFLSHISQIISCISKSTTYNLIYKSLMLYIHYNLTNVIKKCKHPNKNLSFSSRLSPVPPRCLNCPLGVLASTLRTPMVKQHTFDTCIFPFLSWLHTAIIQEINGTIAMKGYLVVNNAFGRGYILEYNVSQCFSTSPFS